MKALLLWISVGCASVFADTWGVGSIVQVWPNPRVLTGNKPIKEYIIDLGSREGLTEGQTLSVYRHIPVLSPHSVGPWDSVKVLLGELKVVSTAERSSIARMSSAVDMSRLPTLDYAMFLIGDSVELKSELPIQ